LAAAVVWRLSRGVNASAGETSVIVRGVVVRVEGDVSEKDGVAAGAVCVGGVFLAGRRGCAGA